ncbi:DDB1- and CUL4-associated factor 6 [Homalodisca vitripennis]|nr:DDB1- and CUL4-associated factor 6 [Homalodisca vitripennis]
MRFESGSAILVRYKKLKQFKIYTEIAQLASDVESEAHVFVRQTKVKLSALYSTLLNLGTISKESFFFHLKCGATEVRIDAQGHIRLVLSRPTITYQLIQRDLTSEDLGIDLRLMRHHGKVCWSGIKAGTKRSGYFSLGSQRICGAGNLDFIQRLSLQRSLPVHSGCVNCICWSDTGEFLLSGSDDQHLVISHAYNYKTLTNYKTSHRANIFSAKFLPCSSDRNIVSCSGDGIILFTDLMRPSETRHNQFNCHKGTTYEIATVPNEPHTFLSCGEDYTVRCYDLRIKERCTKDNCDDACLIYSNVDYSIPSSVIPSPKPSPNYTTVIPSPKPSPSYTTVIPSPKPSPSYTTVIPSPKPSPSYATVTQTVDRVGEGVLIQYAELERGTLMQMAALCGCAKLLNNLRIKCYENNGPRSTFHLLVALCHGREVTCYAIAASFRRVSLAVLMYVVYKYLDTGQDVLVFCQRAVTAVSINNVRPYQMAVGCSDSTVRIFDRRMIGTKSSGFLTSGRRPRPFVAFTPPLMEDRSYRITSLAFSPQGEDVLVSYSSEQLYMFSIKV